MRRCESLSKSFYTKAPIHERPKFQWPNGATLAVVLSINLETWDIHTDVPYSSGPEILPLVGLPKGYENFPNYTWREYGPRVGIWRLMKYLSERDIPVTIPFNTRFGLEYPEILEKAKELGWTFMPHCQTQHQNLAYLAKDPEAEKAIIQASTKQFEEIMGYRPKGWMSPSLAYTLNTLEILQNEGYLYTCDIQNDDQPYLIEFEHGKNLVSVPYNSEINDYPIYIRRGNTPDQFLNYVKQEFDVLLEESEESPRVFSLGIHPHVTGRPARAKALADFIDYAKQHDNVWFTTYDEMAQWVINQSLIQK